MIFGAGSLFAFVFARCCSRRIEVVCKYRLCTGVINRVPARSEENPPRVEFVRQTVAIFFEAIAMRVLCEDEDRYSFPEI